MLSCSHCCTASMPACLKARRICTQAEGIESNLRPNMLYASRTPHSKHASLASQVHARSASAQLELPSLLTSCTPVSTCDCSRASPASMPAAVHQFMNPTVGLPMSSTSHCAAYATVYALQPKSLGLYCMYMTRFAVVLPALPRVSLQLEG